MVAERIEKAIRLAVRYGQTDEGHHKAWVIDQMVRLLADECYDEIVREFENGEDGPKTYKWDVGIVP